DYSLIGYSDSSALAFDRSFCIISRTIFVDSSSIERFLSIRPVLKLLRDFHHDHYLKWRKYFIYFRFEEAALQLR
ncbi:hypothetical protein GIB67_039793, partial [Kingdonia uniflora]